MRHLTRILFGRVFIATFYSTIALTFCAWMVQASKYLDVLTNNVSLMRFFRFTSLLSIDIIVFILPISFAISAAFVYLRFTESNQLLALQSAGISPRKILRPIISLGLIITGLLYVCNAYISPLAWREFRNMEFQIKNNIEPPTNAGLIFSGNDVSVYAQKYLGRLTFGNIIIIDSRTPNKVCSMSAKFGTLSENILILKDGERSEVNFAKKQNSKTSFGSYVYNLNEILKQQHPQRRANEYFIHELFSADSNDVDKNKENVAMFHQKMATPLLALIFPLMAFYFIALAPYKRDTSYLRMAKLICVIIVIQGISLAFANISARNELFIAINYLFLATMLMFSIWLMRKK